MPRMGESYHQATPYPIAQRGHDRNVVFASVSDYRCYLDTLIEFKESLGVKIYSFKRWPIMKTNRYASLYLLVIAGLLFVGTTVVWANESVIVEKSIKQPILDPLNARVVYTIEGKKDPRLQATFLATYISTSKSEACSHQNPTTATRKVNIGSKRYPITEEHYRIEIPVYLEENENQCGYRFSRIELMLRRLYDGDLYSRHILLDKTSKVSAIYYGGKTGTRGGGETQICQLHCSQTSAIIE